MKLKGMVIALGIIACLLTPTIAQATTYQGADRYETAALIAIDSGSKDITIVSGENFPDALSAINLGNPVLLAKVNEIPQATVDALLTIVPDSITIIGGEDVISSEVATQLETYIKPIYAKIKGDGSHADLRVTLHPKAARIAGADRYETNALTITTVGIPLTVASGENYPDALSASNLGNVVLVKQNEVPAVTVQAIIDAEAYAITIVGGEAVISAEVETELETYLHPLDVTFGETHSIQRLAGADRYETNFLTIGDFSRLTFATGENFPDALAAAYVGEQLMLVPSNVQSLPDWCKNAIDYNYVGAVDQTAIEAALIGE